MSKALIPDEGKALELHYFPDRKMTDFDRIYAESCRERFVVDGELECDLTTAVSVGGDPGAYVMCWRWVSWEELVFPKRVKAIVYFEDEEGIKHALGSADFLSFEPNQEALDRFWDDRLDATSCVPVVEIIPYSMTDYHLYIGPRDGEDDERVHLVVPAYNISDVAQVITMVFNPADFRILLELPTGFRILIGNEDGAAGWWVKYDEAAPTLFDAGREEGAEL